MAALVPCSLEARFLQSRWMQRMEPLRTARITWRWRRFQAAQTRCSLRGHKTFFDAVWPAAAYGEIRRILRRVLPAESHLRSMLSHRLVPQCRCCILATTADYGARQTG